MTTTYHALFDIENSRFLREGLNTTTETQVREALLHFFDHYDEQKSVDENALNNGIRILRKDSMFPTDEIAEEPEQKGSE